MSAETERLVNLVAFGVILDDIIFPDGRSVMAVLGGGGPQTAFGMRLWSPSVGLVAGVNRMDLPVVKTWLEQSGIDTAGLRVNDLPTPRAWQLLEADGRRTQVWRVEPPAIYAQLGRVLGDLPVDYRQASGFHFGIHPDEPDLDFMAALHSLGGLVSIEPFKPADRQPSLGQLQHLLSQVDIFSTNLLEAQSLVGEGEPDELAKRLLDLGATVVVVRLGAQGSLVASRRPAIQIHLPAVEVRVVDPVGAGNAYCGGFLAGWLQTGDLAQAGAWGAVAASFLVEQVGVPPITAERLELARERAQRVFQMIADDRGFFSPRQLEQ